MEPKEQQLNYQLDLKTLKAVAQGSPGSEQQLNLDISERIGEALKKAFTSLGQWVEEFNVLVQSQKHLEAYELFIKNKGNLFVVRGNFFEDLLLLDRKQLGHDKKKEFLFYAILVAANELKYAKAEALIDEYIRDFKDETNRKVSKIIILSKAKCRFGGKINVAYINFLKTINDADTEAIDLAYAYRGMGLIAADQQERIDYGLLCVDRFLEAGNKNEAVIELANLSDLNSTKSSQRSLELIDQAISLYDTSNILNKELTAGLYQRKASYLVALGEQRLALESTEKACELRGELVGNEHAQYASFSIALSLAEGLKEQEKIDYYKKKIGDIEPLIRTDEFDLQKLLQSDMLAKRSIEGPLLERLEASDYRFMKFGVYLHNALQDTITFEAQLEWLDKSKLILDKKIFENHHYALFYHTLGETYRKIENYDDAIKNYELSLNYNPFNWNAIQNCSYTVFKSEKWSKAKEFFTAQINKLGERPGLQYGLARAHLALEEYQPAFGLFRKINGKVDADVTGYINTCLEKNDNLILQPTTEIQTVPTAPISLASFRATLKTFANSIATNSRMHFWQYDKGDYKWKSKPEEMAKQHLITALETKFEKGGIDIIQERLPCIIDLIFYAE